MQCPGANRSMQQQPMMRLNARPMGVCPGASQQFNNGAVGLPNKFFERDITDNSSTLGTRGNRSLQQQPLMIQNAAPNRSLPAQLRPTGRPMGVYQGYNSADRITQESVVITTTDIPGVYRPPPPPEPVRSPGLERSMLRFGGRMPAHSTPIRSSFTTPLELTISTDEFYEDVEGLPSKYLDKNITDISSTVGTSIFDVSSDVNSSIFDSRPSSPRSGRGARSGGGVPSRPRSKGVKGRKTQSLLQWFDKTCEKELTMRKPGSYTNIDISRSKGTENPHVVEGSTSGIEIQAMLRGEQNTELKEACDKLAKAQAMDAFEGAVKAAEMAAANAPPEFAEEAAAAASRGYQAELTTVVQQKIPGIKPMEVIGYVGVTRPKKPKKS